eukprot:COSAG01_NODE_8523_length_2753_cov_37.942847_5_plen_45_part_01
MMIRTELATDRNVVGEFRSQSLMRCLSYHENVAVVAVLSGRGVDG